MISGHNSHCQAIVTAAILFYGLISSIVSVHHPWLYTVPVNVVIVVLMFHKCYCHPESERNQKTWRMYKTNRTLHVLINPIPAFLIQWECNSAGISHSWQIKWILHMILLNILFPGLMAGSDPCLDDMIRFVSLMKMVIVASDQQ